MKTKYKALFVIFLAVLLALDIVFGLQSIVEKHETVHAKINDNFGIKSKITTDFLAGSTEYSFNENNTKEDIRIIKSLHSVNELVTYQFYTFYLQLSLQILLIVIMLFIFYMKVEKHE